MQNIGNLQPHAICTVRDVRWRGRVRDAGVEGGGVLAKLQWWRPPRDTRHSV